MKPVCSRVPVEKLVKPFSIRQNRQIAIKRSRWHSVGYIIRTLLLNQHLNSDTNRVTTVYKVCICFWELNLLELSMLVYCLSPSPFCISICIECICICFSICICLHIRVVFAEILRARRTTTLLTHFIYTINSFSVLAKRQTDGATFLARAVFVSVSVNISVSVSVSVWVCVPPLLLLLYLLFDK